MSTSRLTLPFPLGGYSARGPIRWQPATQRGPTTPYARNVRGHDPATGRLRGASRWGHSRHVASTVNSTNFVQGLTQVVVSSSLSGLSVRTPYNMAVAGGSVYSFTTSGFTAATTGTSILSSTTPHLGMATVFGKVYFADGANWKLWDAATNTCSTWTASAGSLPVSGSDTPRLIARYRGRIVLSGLKGDGHNWFMSAVGDPTDFDYGIEEETAAVAGNNTDTGLVEDVVTALIPFSDEMMMFGGDSSLWILDSDPMAGGRFYNISREIGVAFGSAWCRDPLGRVFFFGSQGGFYMIAPSNDLQLLKLSDPVDEELANVDLTKTAVRLIYEDRSKSVMVYLTPNDGSAGTHYCYDTVNQAWWPDTWVTAGHQPTAVYTFDGDLPNDRVTVLGCRDGYLRKIDFSSKNDDDQAIVSLVKLGPVKVSQGMPFQLQGHLLELSTASDATNAYVWDGRSPQDALATVTPRITDAWSGTRTHWSRKKATGSAMYFGLGNSTIDRRWAMEGWTAEITPRTGRILQ